MLEIESIDISNFRLVKYNSKNHIDEELDGKMYVKLIECNCFGSCNGARSSLFHWIDDHDKLFNTDYKTYFRYMKGETRCYKCLIFLCNI